MTEIRTLYSTPRDLDFATEEELTAQTGHPPAEWPLVILKELMDNSLDACEETGIAPRIDICVDAGSIVIADNGPGISAGAINQMLKFSQRVSSREAYADPCRGAQGNAFKTILAIPVVLSRSTGTVIITSSGQQHTITGRIDQVKQTPVFTIESAPVGVKSGTSIKVVWPDIACSILDEAKTRFLQIAQDFTVLNPHLHLGVDWHGEVFEVQPTNTGWKKWAPKEPTSAHWYTLESFQRLLGAHIAHSEQTGLQCTVREFVNKFRGFAGSAAQKVVLAATGNDRVKLSELATAGQFDAERTQALLAALKSNSKPVAAKNLGVIGSAHIRQRLEALGGSPRSYKYTKVITEDPQKPQVYEIAFAPRGDDAGLRIVSGVNWSASVNIVFKKIGDVSLDALLRDREITRKDPVIVFIHMVSPSTSFHDRGKSSVVLQEGV